MMPNTGAAIPVAGHVIDNVLGRVREKAGRVSNFYVNDGGLLWARVNTPQQARRAQKNLHGVTALGKTVKFFCQTTCPEDWPPGIVPVSGPTGQTGLDTATR